MTRASLSTARLCPNKRGLWPYTSTTSIWAITILNQADQLAINISHTMPTAGSMTRTRRIRRACRATPASQTWRWKRWHWSRPQGAASKRKEKVQCRIISSATWAPAMSRIGTPLTISHIPIWTQHIRSSQETSSSVLNWRVKATNMTTCLSKRKRTRRSSQEMTQ